MFEPRVRGYILLMLITPMATSGVNVEVKTVLDWEKKEWEMKGGTETKLIEIFIHSCSIVEFVINHFLIPHFLFPLTVSLSLLLFLVYSFSLLSPWLSCSLYLSISSHFSLSLTLSRLLSLPYSFSFTLCPLLFLVYSFSLTLSPLLSPWLSFPLSIYLFPFLSLPFS